MSLSQTDECGEQDLKCFLDPFFEENDLYFHHYAETNVINNSKNCNFPYSSSPISKVFQVREEIRLLTPSLHSFVLSAHASFRKNFLEARI